MMQKEENKKFSRSRLKTQEFFSNENLQIRVLIILSLVILSFTVGLYLSNPFIFSIFFGQLNPLLIITAVIILGFLILPFLSSYGFQVYSFKNFNVISLSFILAPLLTLNVIFIDLNFGYSEDINILLPQSLLYYPTMGFIIEILFHSLPLFLLLFFLTNRNKKTLSVFKIWSPIIIVSLIEPIFQIILGHPIEFPLWIIIFFGSHLFIFNLIQLVMFKQYGFFAMFLFRMGYYLFWHIIWGYLRLVLIF
ncbi:MAG: hypothetical protein ACW99L_16645 [Promethearchaeota archaeon]|jgi:hypothetical protein